MSALHKRNLDSPRARFGCEVALRFLAPSNPASQVTPAVFAEYLEQPWYQNLLEWSEYRWDGGLTVLRDGTEAYQQIGVRSSPTAEWASIRWILVRVPIYGKSLSGAGLEAEAGASVGAVMDSQWMLEAVIAEEPDDASAPLVAGIPLASAEARSAPSKARTALPPQLGTR